MSVIINPGGSSGPGTGRTILIGNTSYYVSNAGSDITGNGSIGNPWATLQHASDFLRTIDFGGFTVSLIMREAGTFVGVTNMGGYIGGGQLNVLGATNAPASYIVIDPGVVSGGIFDFSGGDSDTSVSFDQFTFKPIVLANDCIKGAARIPILVGNGGANNYAMDFSGMAGVSCNGFSASAGCNMIVFGNNAVTVPAGGKFIVFFYGALGTSDAQKGYARLQTFANVTFSGSITFSHAYAYAETYGYLEPGDTTVFSAGSGTGKRFHADDYATINTFGASRTALPGDTSGELFSGGQYL